MNINDNSIRIISFNIRCDSGQKGPNRWNNRKDFLCDLIRFHGADIVGCQEVLENQLEDMKERLTDYDFYGVGREDGHSKGEFAPLFFVKDKFEKKEQGVFWLSESPDEVGSLGWDASLPRICCWVKLLDKKQNKSFYVMNVHFDHIGIKAREESSLLLLKKSREIAEGLPVLLCGDFNETPGSKMYEHILQGGFKDCSKACKSYGGSVSFHDFKAVEAFNAALNENDCSKIKRLCLIDFIFCNDKIKVLNHGILTDNMNGFYPSDHMPVLCDFLLH